MKKFIFFIFLVIGIFGVATYFGMQWLANNLPDSQYDGKEIVKVDAQKESVKDEIVKEVIEVNNKIIEKQEPAFALIYPVNGEIGLKYSPDTLVYSKTLKEWIVHNGMDIQAQRGTPVCSSEEGIVESITEKADMGIEIVVSHDDGYKTIYSNLSSRDMVSVGEKVSKGQVISGIGNTASFEYYEPDHLHFEVKKDGKYVNPLDVIKE